jgi:NAD(P)-dependent dehydrogenase (short-subunit alcohol dehydrogenase family)
VGETLVIRQPRLGEDHERVTQALTDAFSQMRGAVLDGRAVVVVLDDRDLLGQGTVADAALATGLLGLARAFALEGARPGWRVNALAHRGAEGEVEDHLDQLAGSALSGQLIRVGTEHLGRVWP